VILGVRIVMTMCRFGEGIAKVTPGSKPVAQSFPLRRQEARESEQSV
jgi:hypothetical protein